MSSSKPYLVTGAAGFIGSRVVESFNQRGVPVISCDSEGHFRSRPEHAGIRFGEIVDKDALFDWLAREKPALAGIAHIGACSRTTETDEDFLRRNNVEYSQKLWEYATRAGVPFVYSSSAATYGAGEHGYDDDESLIPRLQPLNGYGRSKQAFDLWALGQEKLGKHPPAWSGFKYFNVYGHGERHKGSQASVVLHSFDQIRATGEARLFKSHKSGVADGHQMRDFVAVEDVVAVTHFALEKPIRRGIYNLGTGKARPFLDLTRAVFRALGAPEKIRFIDTPVEIRDKYQYFTEARMERLRAQGYSVPFTSLEDGVTRYVERLLKG